MSLMSNIQTGGGLITAPPRAVATTPPPPQVPAFAEAVASPQFPPVAPPANSAAIVLEGQALTPEELAAKAEGIEVDDVPVTNDAAVLIDDIPTLALPEPAQAAPSPPPEPVPDRMAEADQQQTDAALTEAAERVYAEERQISGIDPAPDPADAAAEAAARLAAADPPIPQP